MQGGMPMPPKASPPPFVVGKGLPTYTIASTPNNP